MPTAYHAPSSRPSPTKRDVRDDWRRQIAADPELGRRALRVALVLLNFARGDGRTTVGVGRLATELGADRRTVQRGLAALTRAGHLNRLPGSGTAGRGGKTAATWLALREVAATTAATVRKDTATVDQRGGHGGSEVAATAAAQTILTLEPCDARAPAAQGERAAPLQRELGPMLGTIRKATLESIRRTLGRTRTSGHRLEQSRPEVAGEEIASPARSYEADFGDEANTSARRASESAK
jgi:helix-turn-helix protein